MNNDRLMRKLKNLLAMAEGNANENEAATAMRQLHALLAKHNLSMADLDEQAVGEDYSLQIDRPWKRYFVDDIAQLYFCKSYTQRDGKKTRFYFYGSESNRNFAQAIFTMVVKTIEVESRRASRERYGKEVCGFVNSFWTEAAARISERCQDLMTESMKGTLIDEETGENLPALLSTYEEINIRLDDWATENKNFTQKKIQLTGENHAGRLAGREAGDKVQLSRALSGDPVKRLT